MGRTGAHVPTFDINSLTPEGRLPTAAVGHVKEVIATATPYVGPWRDITALLQDVASVEGFYIRRRQASIDYAIVRVVPGSNGVKIPWNTLPGEYRPTTNGGFDIQGANGSTARATLNSGGGLSITEAFNSVPYWGSGNIATSAPIPTSHPGQATTWGQAPPIPTSPAELQAATTSLTGYIDQQVLDLTNYVDQHPTPVADRSRIAAIGDSQTHGVSDGVVWPVEDSWPYKLGLKLGPDYTVTNAGHGGATVDEVLMRIGAKPMRMNLAADIPHDGSATVAPVGTYALASSARVFSSGQVRLTVQGDVWTISNWSGATIPAGEYVHPPTFPGLASDTAVLWMGGNDRTESLTGMEATVADHIVAAHQQAVAWLTPRVEHVMILGMMPRDVDPAGHPRHDLILEVNERLRALFPGNFRSVMRYLQEGALSDMGVTPTAGDVAAVADDMLPPSVLAADGGHINQAAAQAVGEHFVHDYLAGKGWL